MKKVFEVAMLLTAKDEATRKILEATKKQEAAMKNMSAYGDKAFGVGRTAGVAGIALAGVLAVPLKAAADMESLNIALKSSFQGNAEAAKEAFDNINKFAAQTPFELNEVTTSFLRLKNSGLDPSVKALEAYGNIASSMPGKTLMDFTEAVGDAVMGENERLKEFNISASKSGDLINYTFEGVTTTVKNNAKDIEKYLQYIGNVKFAGATVAQSKSVNGMLSTLKDGAVMAAAKIGTTFIPRLKEIFNQITPVIDKVSAWVAKNPKLTETILKGVAAAALLSFTISALAFTFGGLFKIISAVMWISKTYTAITMAMRAAQMAYTFSILAGSTAGATFTAVVTAMNLAFLASPIFWIIAGIVALGVAVYSVYKNWDKLKVWFTGLWESVKIGFNKFLGFVKEWGLLFLGPIGWVIMAWKMVPDKFKNIGKDILMGLWNGLKSKAMALFDFVKSIGSGIAKAFKTVLGIASPSKVFMDYGVNITEGASNGIKKGQSKLNDTSTGMGKNIIPSGGGRSSGGGGGITVNFAPVINGGSGGVASQVKALIPELIRQIEAKMQRKQALSY